MGIDASKSVSRFRSLLKAKREQFRRLVCEGLERRELMAVFAPGTTEDYRDAWYAANPFLEQGNGGGSGTSIPGAGAFNLAGSRWTSPIGGPSPNMGDPARVSWSIVPDGTRVGSGPADLQASNLITFMDGIYGTAPGPVGNRPWFKLIEKSYENWSKVTGLNFVYEPNDDGVDYSSTAASRGVTGVRGDMRVGGRAIDGNFGVLAYNFLPNSGGTTGFDGDMVIDTADIFYANNSNGPSGENRGLTNVLTHEIGHGIGLGHTIPINSTKLMEPNVTFAFLGVQHDDLLGAQTLYGDDFEANDSNGSATDLGTRSNGIIVLNNLSADRNADVDVFRFTINNPGRVSVTLTPEGQQYTVGNDGGATAPVNTLINKDLSFQVETAAGVILATVNAGGVGIAEAISDLALPNAGTYLIRVLGTGSETQLYNLRITLDGIAPTSGPAIDTFRLLSVAPNSSEIFSNTRPNVLAESPRELVFRFDADLDRTTLSQGIRIRSAGTDKQFTLADTPIVPAFLDFGTSNRIVIARFAEPLPDDLYQVEIFGADIPSEGVRAIRNQTGSQMKPRLANSDRDTYEFNLELGTKIVAVVPQPIDRAANGSLVQRRNDIEIYFNDNELYDIAISTGPGANPSVVDPQYYALIRTQDTVSPNDDILTSPQSIAYDPVLRKATITFVQQIDQLAGNGSFRLRVGSNETVASAAAPQTPSIVVPAQEPQGVLSGAENLGNIAGSFSTIIREEIRTVSNALLLDYPGSKYEPGHRDIQEENQLWRPVGPALPQGTLDSSSQIATIFYSFMENESYGTDSVGRPLFTSITPDQKQRVREVYEFYSAQLGIDFVEHTGPIQAGMHRIVVGDMYPNFYVSAPGNELGIGLPGQNRNQVSLQAIMDGSEAWDNTFGLGSNNANTRNFFSATMREIGHLLGLGDSFDLPPGTNQGSEALLGRAANPLEQIFPGDNDVVHGQHLYRPDNRDTDLYRFVVAAGVRGELRAETIAERLNQSSNLDTHLTLLQRGADGSLNIVAANNNYASDDSLIRVELDAGEYFLAVVAKGHEDNNPLIADSGSGGRSQGRYELRVDFKNLSVGQMVEERSGSTAKGSALDGDGDGIAGGEFNFWFRAAAPLAVAEVGLPNRGARTIVVDKAFTGVTRDGSLAQPFNKISDATLAAKPGDIIRLVGDKRTSSMTDDVAYEIGNAGSPVGVLSDGATLDVPKGVTLMIDSGAVLKFAGSRILVGSEDATTDRSGAGIQVLGIPGAPVYFTSHFDQTIGVDTNPLVTTPNPGNWGGIEIRNDFDRSQGRADLEREGVFLNTISNANIQYGGGVVGVGAQGRVVSPIHLAEARPLIVGNMISRGGDAAISIDPNGFEETLFTEPRYQQVGAFVPNYTRVGPEIRSNVLSQNTINGLFVRIDTVSGQGLKPLNVPARVNDSEITIVLGENLVIEGTPGGARNETIGPDVSTLFLSSIVPPAGSSGFATAVFAEYLITFVDRFGQESLPSAIRSINVPAARSVQLVNLPVATLDYVGRKVYRRENNTNPFRLVANVNKDDTTLVDNGQTLPGTLQTFGLTSIQRARRDASLVVDPGVIFKSLGGRIEIGISATMLAEGTPTKPIIFTSRFDDRFGAAGTFDTNNDGFASTPTPGDWSGIISRHLGELSIDNATISFGGGNSRIPGGFASFNAIESHQSTLRVTNSNIESNLSGAATPGTTNRDARGVNQPAVIFVVGSQPVILNNIIRNNSVTGTAAISIDANSLNHRAVRDYGRSTGRNERENVGIGNFGPLVQNNQLGNNALNGMSVRGATLTTESVWDDTDIVHILQSEIVIPDFHTYGGLRLTSKSDESLVVKLSGAAAGFTATGRPLDIKDRIGGSLQILGSPGFPVTLTSLDDDSIGAGYNFAGAAMLDTNNNGSASNAAPGAWRSVLIAPFSNDRNVALATERESDQLGGAGDNDFPSQAQDLGTLAPNLNAGDENLRLGFTLSGSIATPRDLDVYRFAGTAGTTVWVDIDQSAGGLDSVVELIDANGNIITLSNDSLTESVGGSIFSDSALIPAGRALPMDQQASAKRNALSTAQVDFQGVNPLDAGLRVVLPGAAGSFNNYFVRVRSSNVSPVPDIINGISVPRNDPNRLTDEALVPLGISTGVYKLQLRLQQQQEIAGTSIQFADIRFASTGIDVQGQLMHSPLLGEYGESNPAETANTSASAINIGNILNNDRGAASIAGNLQVPADLDWYNFSVGRDSTAPFSTITPSRNAHQSITFDIDYADGLGRANTQLWLYRRAANGDLTLIATGDSSNIHDDQSVPTRESDNSDITRGSKGTRDAYIGPFELQAGDYTVVVGNASLSSAVLQQYNVAAPVSSLVRLEPLDSIRRIAEDRFDSTSVPLSNQSTNLAPVQVAFGEIITSTAVPNAGNPGLPNAVPFNLSDVTLFASNGRNVQFLNALTGAQEAIYSTNGTSAVNFGPNINNLNDMAVSPGGLAVGFQNNTGVRQDSNSGTFVGIDIGNGAPTTANSGINTFLSRIVTPVATPPTFETIQVPNNGGNNGIGMIFDGLTFSPQFATGDSPSFWGVASRGNAANFEQPILGGQNQDTTAGLSGINGITRNILYRLNSLADGNVGAARSPIGAGAGTTTRNGAQQGLGAGTNIVEHGYFVRAAGFGGGLTPISGWTDANGTVTGLTTLATATANPTRYYAVTNQGELMSILINAENQGQRWSDQYTTIVDPETNLLINFSGLTAGPRNLEGGRYANLLFGVATNGRIYAFNTAGQLQPIFPRGASFIQGPAGVNGIDFSSLDVNLWHATNQDSGTAGHGRLENPNNSRGGTNGTRSLKFGFTDPAQAAAQRQAGNWTGIYNVPAFYDNVSLPGGAMGALESDLIDLRNYSANDQPMLYFNYVANTEGTNSPRGDNADMLDSLRVYGVGEDGTWVLLATNNSARTAGNYNATAGLVDEYDVQQGLNPINANQDAFGRSYLTQELFDGAGWRQARVNLAPLAGKRDVRLRFEFATGGDFRTGDVTRGGQELIAVAGDRLLDGQTFTLTAAASGNLAGSTRIFEFDLGLVLNLPSAASLVDGDQIRINATNFTFRTTPTVATDILLTPNATPTQVATAVRNVLVAAGLTVETSTATPNVLNVTGLPAAGVYQIIGAAPTIIAGLPGVTAGNVAVNINNAMTATQVRDSIRTSMAATFNNPLPAGNLTNIAVYPVRGNAIVLHNISIGNRGPLQATVARIGDTFGPRDGAAAPNLFRASAKARNNTASLVRLDDFIIGFAERGEMVLNAPVNNQAFEATFEYENIGAAGGGRIDENESGAYQLEIRTSADYGTSANARDLDLTTVPGLPPTQRGRTFDTNDRLTKSYALTFASASQIADGATFTLSDGVNTATFEFDVLVAGEVRGVGVRPENIGIQIQPNATDVQVARAIRDAINSSTAQQRIKLNASTSGDMTGASAAATGARSRIIQLHGQVSANLLGGTNYSAGGVPLTLITYGADVTALGTDFGEDLGDANVAREQGQLVISSSVIRESSGFGINIDAAAQNQTGLAAGAGIRPYPGVARNLVTLNTANVAAGVVAMNNLITGNRSGGINISGDTVSTNGIPVRSMARIVNNTLYGPPSGTNTVTGTGISINEGSIPTLLNNVIASFATGILYAGPTTGPQPELGGNIYQSNGTPINPATLPESFGISLLASDPLFVSSSTDRFYLKTLSRAIDSSLGSLENRSIIEQVKEGIGIPTSPIIAPAFDLNGLRRSDDPLVNTPAGQGQNVFIDRGAIDRVDFIGPSAVLALPIDNDAAGVDFDPGSTFLQLLSGNYDFFEILLDERSGTGVDAITLNANNLNLIPLILTENGRRLIPGNDFIFGYSVNSRTIRLTPLAGFWRQDSVYEITLVNRTSVRMTAPAGNSITDGQRITFTAGATPVILEFDTGNGVGAGAIAVPVASNFTSAMVAGQILKVLNQLAGLGVDADAISNDTLLVNGVASFITPFAGTVTIAPITDFASNNLQANRPNSLTQFTIAMPQAVVDYGDAIERSGTGAISNTVLSGTPFIDGARHVLYPIDEPLLVLGRYADGDANGVPSIGADADDNDSSIDLTGVPTFSVGNNGPIRLTTLASTVDLQNKSITISDNVFNVVTFQFKHDNSAVTIANAIPVSVAVAATANDVALALRNAIHNEAILKGRLFGISAQVAGNVISIDASSSHLFDLSGSVHNTVPFIQRQNTGTQTIQVRLPANDAALANGLRTFTIVDGSGNTVVFQLVDKSAAVQSSVLGGNVPVFVNINPIASPAEPADTDATFATKVAAAINGAIASRRLNLPTVTVLGNEVRVLADDEDGVSFRGYFNAVYNSGTAANGNRPATPGVPVVTTITASNAGFIDAWVDWNQDNDFEDAGEKIISTQPVIAGSNLFNIITPATAIIGYTTARFRLSATGGALTTGLAVGGEVEDHLIEVVTGSPPVAVNDAFTVNENGRLTSVLNVAAPGVLANDFDADDQNSIRVYDENRTSTTDVSMQPLVAPKFGSLALNPDGSFTYTPNPHFNGVDTFVYRTTDARMVSANAATVTLTVHKVNDDPKAFDDTRAIDEDTVIEWTWADLTANDFAGITTQPQRVGDSVGLEILGYDANGVLLTGATDRGFGSERDQNLNIVNVRLLGSARLNPNEALGLENVTIVNPTDSNRANRKVRYAPGTNYNNLIAGPVLIEITIEDEEVNLNGAPAANNTPRQTKSTLTVNINAMNDRPAVIVNGGVLQVDYTEDVNPAKTLPVTVTAGPVATATAGGADDENGLVPANIAGQNTSFNTTSPDVTRVRALDPSLFSVQPTITLATGADVARTLSFTLAPDVNSLVSGPILIEIFGMDDGQLAGPGGLGGVHLNESVRQTLTLNVAPVNDAPFATNDSRRIDEDTSVVIAATTILSNDYAGHNSTLTNPRIDNEERDNPATPPEDRDEDQRIRIVSVQLINAAGAVRTAKPGESLSWPAGESAATGLSELQYTPGTNYNDLIDGPVLVLVTIEDSGVSGPLPTPTLDAKQATSTLTININAMNDRPVVTLDPTATLSNLVPTANGAQLNVSEDPGAQSIPVSVTAGPVGIVGAAIGVSGGADDENGRVPANIAGQNTSFNTTSPDVTRVRALDPSLFSVQPTITLATGADVARTLSFTLAPDVNSLVSGPILIEIFGMDDGQLAGPGGLGGVHLNESVRQTLTLNVAPVNDAPFATNDSQRIDEDTSIVIAATTILSNDYAGHNSTLTNPRIDNEERDNPATPPEDRDEDQRIRIVSVQLINAAGAVRTAKPGESLSWPAGETAATGLSEIRYTPGTNYNDLIDGPVFVLVTIEDTGVSGPLPTPTLDAKQATSILTININAMNDRPVVTLDPTATLSNLVPTANGAQLNVSEDPGAQTIPVSVTAGPVGIVGAAIGVSGGADDENGRVPANIAGQNTSFNTTSPDVTRVRALDPSLFSVQPTITLATGADVARTLSFTLAPDVNSLVSGPILIEIFGMDDGQLAGPGGLGGVHLNESVRQTLTLNVAPVNDAPFATNDVDTIDEDIAKNWPTSFLLSNDYAGHNPNKVPPKVDNEDNQTIRVKSVQLINPNGSPRTAYPGESLTLTTGTNPELQFTPGTNYNSLIAGAVLVLVEIEDNGVSGVLPNQTPDPKTAFSTLTINIDAINDRPIVTVDPNRTKIDPTLASSGVLQLNVLEDPGQQVIPIIAIAGPSGVAGQPLGRSGGADDELGLAPPTGQQSIAFTNLTVRALRPALFAVQPQIVAATGTSIDRNLTFTLAPDVNFVSAGIIEIEIFGTDDGQTGNGTAGGVHLPQSVRQTLSIRVSEINDPPIFDLASTTITIDEDAPRQVLPAFYFNEFAGPLTAIDEIPPAPTAQTVIRSVSVPPEAVDLYAVLPTLDPLTGEVQFQYKQDVNSNFSALRGVPGLFNLIFTATDDGRENGTPVPRSTSKIVSVTVNPINDSPFYTLSRSRVDVIEDAGPVTEAAFATNVRQAFNLLNGQMTAADEVNQVLTFNMNFSNPSLFSTPPAIDAFGVLTFRTAPHQNGTSVVTARLVDDGAASPFPNNNLGPVLTFTISVQAINDAPEFSIPANLNVNEDAGVVSIPGFATGIRPGPAVASDENRQSLTFNLDSFDPNLFEVAPSIQPDGTLSFRTKLNVNSQTPGINRLVTFQLQDGGLAGPNPNTNLSIKQTFTLDISPVNDPPIPNIHTVTDVLEDSRITVLASAVLVGDVAGPVDEVNAGQVVRMTQIAPTSEFGGTVIPIMQGNVVVSFDYIPPPNLAGIDTIQYVVTDNGSPERSATGTIVIRPTGVNDPPQFTPGNDLSVLEDSAPFSATWATNIVAGPPDENSQVVSFIVAPAVATDSKYFAVQPAINSAGVLTFTLAKDVNGVVALDVFARDNGGNNASVGDVNFSPTHRLTISIGAVNDPAGFVLGGPIVVDEDSGPFSAPFMSNIVPAEGLNSNPPTATDESNQSVTILVSNNNSRLFAVQPTIDASGRLTFTPADNAFGSVEVYVDVVDNGPSSPPNVNTSARQTFTITLSSKNDNPIANADQYSTTEDGLLTIAAPGLLANDLDPDNEAIKVLVPAGNLTSTIGARVVLNADGSFSYDPRSTARLQELRAGETIVDSFTYSIGDNFNGTSNIASVAITVTGVNDAPVAVNDSFQVAVGTTTLLDVLLNDRDVDSTLNLTSIEIGQLPANGTAIALSTGRVEFRSAPGFVGVNTFTYRVRDALGAISNEATVSVNTSIPPVAGNDVVSTIRNQAIDIDVLRNDSDPDANGGLNPASVTITSLPSSGSAVVLNDGKIRYTPLTGFVGVVSLQYTVADITGQISNVATVTIQVLTSLFQNPDNQLDVDDDGSVSAIDVLVLVNEINARGQRVLPDTFVPPPYLDVDGDGSLTSLDVLAVVNFINSRGNGGAGEGEGESVPDLDWKPINVEVMSPEVFNQAYKESVLRDSMIEFDLNIAKTLREEFGYGPTLANEEGDEPESLADYLAAWEDMDNDEDEFDSVFANSDWL